MAKIAIKSKIDKTRIFLVDLHKKTKGGKMSTSEEFLSSFRAVGTDTSVTCHCGKTHFNSNPSAWHDDEAGLNNLIRFAKKDKRYQEHNDTVSYFFWGNDPIVWGCSCESDKKLEQTIWKHRNQISSFLNERLKKEKGKSDKDLKRNLVG